jgi:hypothetical protein
MILLSLYRLEALQRYLLPVQYLKSRSLKALLQQLFLSVLDGLQDKVVLHLGLSELLNCGR